MIEIAILSSSFPPLSSGGGATEDNGDYPVNNIMPDQKIPVFIINLKKDTKKKEYMQELCRKWNLDAEFIDAVDGKQLSKKERANIYSQEKALNAIGRGMTKGEVGTVMSHKNIYQKMIDKNLEMALILEDDIVFDSKLLKSLNVIEKFPLDWEVVLLGHHAGCSREIATRYNVWYKKNISKKLILRRPCETGYGAYGYLIAKNGAKKLINSLDIISKPIDHYTGDDKYINLYVVQEPTILIHKELTEMSNLKTDREKLQKTHISLFNNRAESLQKKIAKSLGILQVIIDLRENIKMLIKRIKPLRKYQ